MRLWNLSAIPSSLYSDEVAQGYNAYSILKTGNDEFGHFLPVAYRSFGDWKPALSTYLAIPGIILFGLNETGIRIAPAVLNTLAVFVVYLFIKELLSGKKYRQKLALLGSFLIAVSPWHILHSRALFFEAQGLLFLMTGVLFFLKFLRGRILYLYVSVPAFVLSVYAYHSLRIFTPLIVLFLVISFVRKIYPLGNKLILPLLFGFILVLPLALSFVKNPDVILGRAKYISIFYDREVPLSIWKKETEDASSSSIILTNFLHNKPYNYLLEVSRNYLSHFDGRFLFLSGDTKTPFQIPGMGILYLLDLPLILAGVYFIIRKKETNSRLLIFWLLISPIPAALTFLVPSSNRILNVLPVLVIFTGYGLIQLLKKTKLTAILFSFAFALSLAYFMHQYFIVLPLNHSGWWHYGTKQLVTALNKPEYSGKNVIVSNSLGVPYIFFLFYNSYDPSLYQKEGKYNGTIDKLGFVHVDSFDRYEFPREFNWEEVKNNPLPGTIYVVGPDESKEETNQNETIYYPDGKIAYKIFITPVRKNLFK